MRREGWPHGSIQPVGNGDLLVTVYDPHDPETDDEDGPEAA